MVQKINRAIGGVFDVVAAFVLFILCITILAQVVMRVFFGSGLFWSIETSVYLFIFLGAFSGIVLVSREGFLALNITVLFRSKGSVYKTVTTAVSRIANIVAPTVLAIASLHWWTSVEGLALTATGVPQRFVVSVMLFAFSVMALTQLLTLFSPPKNNLPAL